MRPIRHLASLTVALAIAACGGQSPSQPASAPVQRTVHGAVVKGPLVGATVSFFHVDAAGFPIGAAIATAVTDAQGHISAGLPQSSERLLAVSSGGSYVDEADDAGGDNRRRITLAANQGFEAIVPPNADTFVLTPYSMALLVRARRLADGVNFAGVYEAVLTQAIGVFGFDPTAVIPADPLAPNDGGDARYALLLGGAAYAIGSIATNLGGVPTYAVVRSFIEDLSDGALDGSVGDEAIVYALAKALPLDNVDLNDEIVRFRNNHFQQYDGVPLIEIDENEWSVDPPLPEVQPPVAATDAIQVDEGGTATSLVGGATSVLANDTDPQGAPLTAILVTPPAHGSLTLNANGTFSYTHDGGDSVVDGFVYKANNGSEDSLPAGVTITITPLPNELPVAFDDGYIGHKNEILNVVPPGVLFNDTDADGDTLTAVLVTPPQHGILLLDPDGGFRYTPANDFVGQDLFTYRANDGHGNSNLATVQIQVLPTNRPPVAADDFYQTSENKTLAVASPGLLANDGDPDGDPLTVILVTPPNVGTLTLTPQGSFSYTPPINFTGGATFEYKVSDGALESDVATVHIGVQAGNSPPIGMPDSFTWTGGTLSVPAPGVLANDTDPDGDPLSAQLVSGPTQGTLDFNADGSFTYTFGFSDKARRSAKACGCEDQFSYRVTDGQLFSGVVTVTIKISPPNQAPFGTADSYSVVDGGTLTVPAPGVLGNDGDPDGDAITAELLSNPTQGSLTLNADGSFQYQHSPPAAKSRRKAAVQDQFTYRVSDGQAVSGTVTVTIDITPANQAPTGQADSYSVNFGGTLNVAAPGVLGNDSDPDGDPITAELVTDATLGNLTLNADGSFQYTHVPPPPAKARAKVLTQDQFTYRVSDGQLQSADVTVTITINHAPFGTDDSYTVNAGGTLTIVAPGVLGNDGDTDGDAITAILETGPTLGNLTLNPDGSFLYQNTGAGSSDQFTYRVDDGAAQSSVVTVTITINSPPTGTADAYFVNPGQVLAIGAPGVLDNDSDPDGDSITAVVETAPTKGTLVLNADGSFLYQPFSGLGFSEPPDQFTYRVSDGAAQSDPVTVSLEFFLCDCSFPQGRNSPVLTQDGSTVVFLSDDETLDPSKTTSGITDIFVTTFSAAITGGKNVHAKASIDGGTTIRLLAPDGPDADALPDEPNGSVTAVNVTPDGHYLVFTTYASNYGTTTLGFSSQVYRYSLSGADAGEIVLVSAPDDSSNAGNGFSNFSQSISDDGNFVAFNSSSTDLTGFATGGLDQVYRRDITNVVTTLVSVDYLGTSAANGNAYGSSISADGSLVSFESDADNLIAPIFAAKALANRQTFVRNLSGSSTVIASVDSLGNYGDGASNRSWLSPDGTLVAIETQARNLVAGDGTAAGLSEVIVHNLSNGTIFFGVGENVRPSHGVGFTDPDGSSFLGVNAFSSDNQFVSFTSMATNIVANDTNNVQDVFVHSFVTAGMARVNLDGGGNQAVDGSYSKNHALSRDGARIGFDSNAINLDDAIGVQQVYVVDNPLFGVVPKARTPGRQAPRR